MRVLVTGIAGFAGSHLAEHLLSIPSLVVHGMVYRRTGRIQNIKSQLHLHTGDLRNALWVSDVIQEVQPDYAIHLAAWSDVGKSWHQPWMTYELNIHCQLNLLEAIRQFRPSCRILIVTSTEIYGHVQPQELPIHEETPFRPGNPYAVSKIAQDMMALQYWHSHHMPIIRARSFNHIGPGQSDDFVVSAFARQIAQIEAKRRDPIIYVGNLEARRDFSDVRDIVTAYWQLVIKGKPGTAYNIGSGKSYLIRHLLDTLLRLSIVPIEVKIDLNRLRPSDVPDNYCDNSRLVTTTGWQLNYGLEESLSDVLNYWRQHEQTIPYEQENSDGRKTLCQPHSLPA